MIRPDRSVTIRMARVDDAAPLHRLQAGIYEEGQGFVGDGAGSLEALSRKLRSLDPELSCFLVAVDGSLCGWLELHRLIPKRLRHVAMLTLAVAVGQRRRGVASALLTESYAWALRVGVQKISLNVRSGNTAAAMLYRREGFALEGCERLHIRVPGGFEDNLIMAKFLEPRD